MNKFDISAPLGIGFNTMHRFLAAGFCSLFIFSSTASAQRYTLRKPPELKNEFSVGMSMISPADISFSNLGHINAGFFIEGAYDDASVANDSTAGTDQADGKTYYFSFLGIEQVTDASGNPAFDGEYMKASASRAEAVDGPFSFEGDSGMTVGMEIQYVRYLTQERKFGFLVSLCNTGFDFTESNTWDVNIITRSDLFKGENLTGLDGFTGAYTRPIIFDPITQEAYVSTDPISLEDYVLGQTEATGAWNVKASYTNFRIGVVYNMGISRRVNLRASGGLVATMASSNFRWTSAFTVPYDTQDIEISDANSDHKRKFLFGGWADLGAHYRINRNVTAFGSVEFQSTNSFDQETPEGYKIEFDSSSQLYAKTGFTWAF